jgi:FixJ family two-component response regulator
MSFMHIKGHIYLVDDDLEIRIHLSDLLRQSGYGVADYASATDFLTSATRISPAVLVLDMRMPVMTGLDLQKTLTAQAWNLPIIYMSGESHSQEIIDAMKTGAIDFLWKPFPHSQLLQAVEKGLASDLNFRQKEIRLSKVESLYQTLSSREKLIFSLMLLGHGNKRIAAITDLMADTVKKYRAQVMDKMQVDSLAELLSFCKGFEPMNYSD